MSATTYLGPEELARTIRRLGHEIVENNKGTADLVLVGLLSRGYPLARRLAAAIREFEGVEVPVGALDIGLYRDDVTRRGAPPPVRPSDIPGSIDGKTISNHVAQTALTTQIAGAAGGTSGTMDVLDSTDSVSPLTIYLNIASTYSGTGGVTVNSAEIDLLWINVGDTL